MRRRPAAIALVGCSKHPPKIGHPECVKVADEIRAKLK